MTSAQWDAEADRFDEQPDHGLRDPATRTAWRTLVCAALPPAPARVADVGCGTGTLSLLLAEAGYDVIGLDSSPAMLAHAADKCAGQRVELVQGDAADPPLPAGSVDAVLCRHVLWALPDPRAAVQDWIRLLTPAGRLVIIEGRWDTGSGIDANTCCALLIDAGRTPTVTHLREAAYWGRPITDERYLIQA